MRDAFGGAFMIKLFLVFIFVYICLTAMAVNYAKAFKVKNEIVAYLEENEIADITAINAKDMMTMEDFFEKELIGKRGYSVVEYNVCKNIRYSEDEKVYCHDSGIVIRQSKNAVNTEGVYYTVSTYVGWGVPFLSKLSELNGNNEKQDTISGLWRISGETRLVVSK